MAWIAAKTSRIRLVAAVLVVPHRPAVLAAKMLSTLDVLSGGRLVVGIGAGWLKAEFDAVVTTPFAERGKVTDEYIDAFRVLWTEAKPRFDGKLREVRRHRARAQAGAEAASADLGRRRGPPALRRAARVGDAWYPIGSNNEHLLDTLPRLEAGIARLRQATADAGRDPRRSGVGFRVKRYGAAVPPKATDGERRLFSGSEADLIADLRACARSASRAIDIDFGRPDADAVIAEMRRFRAAVIEKM